MIKRLFKNIRVGFDPNTVVVKWSANKATKNNIGDAINPFLFQKIFSKSIINVKNVLNLGVPPVYSFIGSVLDNSKVRNLTVLGSGFKSEHSKMLIAPKKVVACRGPLTRKKLINYNISVPEVYGDPAILLPDYLNPDVEKKNKIGVVPHYVDQDNAVLEKWCKRDEVKIIDVFSPMETFVRELKSCELIVSSSLHGIILAHAYQIPATWIRLSDRIAGGDFKFKDYYSSVKSKSNTLNISSQEDLNKVLDKSNLPDISLLKDSLMEAFQDLNHNDFNSNTYLQ